MKNTFVIYKITNLLTGKIYIGQTRHFEARMRAHKSMRDKGTLIVKSISKYGWENHRVDILFSAEGIDKIEGNYIESYYIRYLYSYCRLNKAGMNLNEGDYVQKVTRCQVKKAGVTKYNSWLIKNGKVGVDLLIITKTGEVVDRFSGGDAFEFLSKYSVKTRSRASCIKQTIKKQKWTCVGGGDFIIGYEDDGPYLLYKEFLVKKAKISRSNPVSAKSIDSFKEYHSKVHDKPVLDLRTGYFYDTITEFSLQEGRSASAIKERFQRGKYSGKYIICYN